MNVDSAAAASATRPTPPISTGGEIMTVLVVVLFLLFLIALVLYLRTKHCPGTIGYSRPRVRRPSLSFASPAGLLLRRPLELSVLNSLPVVTFENLELESGLECAVCLSEFKVGEKARFLPKCNHGFHVDCIDMWFLSNSTCPLCRLPVVDVPRACHVLAISSDEGSSSTACSSPDQKQQQQEEKGITLVIDIPVITEGSSPTLAPLAGEIEVTIG